MISNDVKSIESELIGHENTEKNGIKRYALYFSGIITLLLGIIGMAVPVLPTTPFLLFSATCFLKSSPRAYYWLLNNRIFGKFIADYQAGKGISKKHKIITIGILWSTILLSTILISFLWVKILLPLIAVMVSTHIILIKPKNP